MERTQSGQLSTQCSRRGKADCMHGQRTQRHGSCVWQLVQSCPNSWCVFFAGSGADTYATVWRRSVEPLQRFSIALLAQATEQLRAHLQAQGCSDASAQGVPREGQCIARSVGQQTLQQGGEGIALDLGCVVSSSTAISAGIAAVRTLLWRSNGRQSCAGSSRNAFR